MKPFVGKREGKKLLFCIRNNGDVTPLVVRKDDRVVKYNDEQLDWLSKRMKSLSQEEMQILKKHPEIIPIQRTEQKNT